jgi:hypothetical protein
VESVCWGELSTGQSLLASSCRGYANLLACSFLEGRDHLDALPWPGPVDLVLFTGLRVECSLVCALDLEDELGDHLLRHLDDVVVICVCLVTWLVTRRHEIEGV